MPDMGEWVECNNCGKQAPWLPSPRGRVLPDGWSRLEKTTAGLAVFDTPGCEEAWKSTREWHAAPQETWKMLADEGFTATGPEDESQIESPEPEAKAYPKPPKKPRRKTRARV
jgi:hypothetical protein